MVRVLSLHYDPIYFIINKYKEKLKKKKKFQSGDGACNICMPVSFFLLLSPLLLILAPVCSGNCFFSFFFHDVIGGVSKQNAFFAFGVVRILNKWAFFVKETKWKFKTDDASTDQHHCYILTYTQQ